MTITTANVLTQQQQQEIAQLEQAAFRKHHLQNYAFLSNDINFDRRMPCFFLGYVEERLVCFLTLFMPTRQEAEITAFTHPEYWNKGCFGQLFDEARRLLVRVKIKEVLFAVEPQSKSGVGVVRTFGCTHPERSEYRMTADSLKHAPPCGNLQLFEVDHSNKDLFRSALRAVYPGEEMNNFYDAVVDSDLRRGYILYSDRPIGVFNLGMEHGESMLYGVGVAPDFRGKGYGKMLMGCAMREGLKFYPKLTLDVDSDNPVALHLYQECGFKTVFQVDYYRYRLVP